jgi:hypothetical protein
MTKEANNKDRQRCEIWSRTCNGLHEADKQLQ